MRWASYGCAFIAALASFIAVADCIDHATLRSTVWPLAGQFWLLAFVLMLVDEHIKLRHRVFRLEMRREFIDRGRSYIDVPGGSHTLVGRNDAEH